MRIDVERLSAVLPATELVEVLKNEIARLRLTDAEREAIERQAAWLFSQAKNRADIHSCDLLLQEAATLRGLLERLGAANSGDDRRSGGGE